MAGMFSNILGTLSSFFQIGGTGGPALKNSSGTIQARNAADSAFADVSAKVLKANDPDIILDADGNALTLSRNASQSGALQIIFPPAKATDGQVLAQKAGSGSGVVEFEFVSAADTSSCTKTDTTSLAYNATSPVTMFTLPANAVVEKIRVVIDTQFNGTPSMSVGISGTTSKYAGSTDVDLTAPAETQFVIWCAKTAASSPEALIITYSQGGASAGAARVLVDYNVPT